MKVSSLSIVKQFGVLLNMLYKISIDVLNEAQIDVVNMVEWLSEDDGKRWRKICAQITADFRQSLADSLIDLNAPPHLPAGAHQQITASSKFPGGKIYPSDLNTDCQPVSEGQKPLAGQEFIDAAEKWARANGEQMLNATAHGYFFQRQNWHHLPEKDSKIDTIIFGGTKFKNRGTFEFVLALHRKENESVWHSIHVSLGTVFNTTSRVATAKIPVAEAA